MALRATFETLSEIGPLLCPNDPTCWLPRGILRPDLLKKESSFSGMLRVMIGSALAPGSTSDLTEVTSMSYSACGCASTTSVSPPIDLSARSKTELVPLPRLIALYIAPFGL